MEPIEFEHCNIVYAKDQPEYLPLPVHRTPDGTVTSCWQLTFIERLKLLVNGKLYISIMTFNKPLQPLRPVVEWSPDTEAIK